MIGTMTPSWMRGFRLWIVESAHMICRRESASNSLVWISKDWMKLKPRRAAPISLLVYVCPPPGGRILRWEECWTGLTESSLCFVVFGRMMCLRVQTFDSDEVSILLRLTIAGKVGMCQAGIASIYTLIKATV